MQRLAAALAVGALWGADAAFFRKHAGSPVAQVVKLLTDLKTKVTDEGAAEQKAYDKYALWCEETLTRKANDISEAKDEIDTLQDNIIKLGGEIASHGAEIEQLKKDIKANVDSQRQAEGVREKEGAAYEAEKIESEQCLGALEAAVKVLEGSGSKKSAATLQEAQLLSVVAGVRTVLSRSGGSKSPVSGEDLQLVRRFVDHPDQFVGGSTGFLSATQITNNPFGDYAPQSSQVSGILKSMYDSFMADLEKANAEEGKAQESFEKLMETKKAELKTLEDTLLQEETDEASKTKQHADDKELLDDTKKQLEADKELFQETKLGCKAKAAEWAERSALRTEELAGITKAIEILSDPEHTKTFEKASSTFVQLTSQVLRGGRRQDVYLKLAGVARRVQSLGLARLAMQVQSGGHFDKIMTTIDEMVELLRREEQEDIEHKSRCENSLTKNKFDTEDVNHAITKGKKSVERLTSEAGALRDTMAGLRQQINATQDEMDEAKKLRGEEIDEFRQAMKDDTDAIAIIEEAISELAKFYDRQALIQSSADPEYDPDKPKDTPFTEEYKGAAGESRGVISILEMIKEDLHKEISKSREDDAKAQAMYEKSMAKMKESLDSQKSTVAATEKDIAAMELKIADLEEEVKAKEGDLEAETKVKASLDKDCGWIETHFEDRRTKRKAEIDGLMEAKSYLAGVDAGDQV